MSFHHRIRTIYSKELIDILRDRRTLIAMILVPIVLYPLLMLGSIQAVSFQADSIKREAIFIGVLDREHGQSLVHLINLDAEAIARRRAMLDPESDEAKELPAPLENVEIVELGSVEDIEKHVADRKIHIGVVFDSATLVNAPEVQNRVTLLPDLENVRGDHACRRLTEMFERTIERTNNERKRERDLPETFDKPFAVTVVDLSSPPSILGQILPLILILMTITGAIYPAIDLTAGERERGTLESLMVSPVSVVDLIVGKFLVVTTVAIMGAALNLASVTATVYFGGFDKIIASTGGQLPIGKMLFILLCLIPFAVLMSAIMIAVCSHARTFKEAQNYVTPVILAVLIPGGIAAMPATRLEGVMLVMPVGNMVLLARDILLGAIVPAFSVIIVLLSTTLYAAAAVAVAAGVFGHESVVFSDSGSLKGSMTRRLIHPSAKPTVSMSLLFVSMLFPIWFFVQTALSPGLGEDASGLLYGSGWMMPVLFVIVPVAILWYWKVNIRNTLSFRMPDGRHLAAAAVIGLSAWVPAHELNVLQQQLVGIPEAVAESAERMAETLAALPIEAAIVLIALVPAVCEELLFRGFLLSGLSSSAGRWTAIISSAAVFGVFHFFVFKFAVTALLGVLLAYLCWQSRSILPAILAHFLHNALGVVAVLRPELFRWIGIPGGEDDWAHLPPHVLVVGGILFVGGILITMRRASADRGGALRPAAEK